MVLSPARSHSYHGPNCGVNKFPLFGHALLLADFSGKISFGCHTPVAASCLFYRPLAESDWEVVKIVPNQTVFMYFSVAFSLVHFFAYAKKTNIMTNLIYCFAVDF